MTSTTSTTSTTSMTTQTQTFAELGVPHPILEVLAAQGTTEAFPIQADTLPDTLAGRDVLGKGRTGSGKTLAFSIPMIARLGSRLAGLARPGRPIGLVLAPTRELATQIEVVLEPLAKAYGLSTTTIFGGVSQQRQVTALRGGVDIIVACPGRLEDLMGQGHVRLDDVEITVLDEADHMADLGFLPGVTRILAATPAGGQRLLFSATLDNGVDKLVRRFLVDPTQHEVDESGVPAAAMTHHVLRVEDAAAKKSLVRDLAAGSGRRILFMRTKHHAKRLAKELTAAGIPAVDLHGNLSQPARDRNLAAFAAGQVRVLVATDVAARGVHVDDIELVVHVDPPAEHKAYLHRSGRTARAGKEGVVATLVLPAEERDVQQMMRKAGITARAEVVTAASPIVLELIGTRAPHVEPVAAPAAPAAREGQSAGRGRAGRGRSTAGAARDRGLAASAQGHADEPSGRRRRGRGGAGMNAQGAPASDARQAASARSDAGGRAARGGESRGAQSASGRAQSGAPRTGKQAAHSSPQAGRTASGRATIGHMPSGAGRRAPRRASSPQGR